MESNVSTDPLLKNTAMESLRKLEEFKATLFYGKDLFHSTYSLLKYSFGSHSFVDMFKLSSSYPEYQDRYKNVAKSLCHMAVTALEPLFAEEMDAKDISSYLEKMALFWEISRLKDVPGLLQLEELSSIDEMMYKITSLLRGNNIDRKSLNLLPLDFLRHVNKEQPSGTEQSRSMNELPYFLKDLSSHQSSGQSTTSTDIQHSKSRIIQQMDEILDSISAGNFNVLVSQEVSGIQVDENFPLDDVLRITRRSVSAMDNISTFSPDAVEAFFKILEKFFHSIPENEKCLAMEKFYEEWFTKEESLPSFEKNMKDFDSNVIECVNGIGDHVDIQNNLTKFKKIRDKLSWYLMTAPRPTLHRLLMQSLDNKLIVPGVLNILRFCSPLFKLDIKSEKVPSQGISVLLDCIISIFEEEAHRWTNPDQQDRFIYLLSSLCRRKRTAVKDKANEDSSGKFSVPVSEPSILNPSTFVKLFVLPNLMKRSYEVLMLKLLHRLMQTVGVKETRFEWSTALGESGTNALQTPELIQLIVELFMEYESGNQQAADVCHSLLKALGEKLQNDDVVFEQKTADFMLFSLRRYPWWVRYAVCTWFSRTLSAPKPQLPTGLYKCLALDQQEQCEQISVDFPFSPAECFFRSFFELALFDIDLASDFLKRGVSVHPRDENLVEKIALALVDVCERTPCKQRLTTLAPLLSDLLRIFDPSQEVRLIESLCESTFHGLRLIQHLLLLAAATKLAYFKSNNSLKPHFEGDTSSKGSSCQYAHVADDLLQAFCELTKAHAEKEVINLRRSKLPFPPEIKEELLLPAQITIRRDERVYSQLSALFNTACSITRLVSQPPFALQVLINCLAELLFEVQNMRIGTSLDDLPSDQYKSNTVYAVAKPAAAKKQTTIKPEVHESSREESIQHHSAVVTASENRKCCAENELFGAVPLLSTLDSLAAARQISGAAMRRNAEKRLVNKDNEENVSAPLQKEENSGKNGKKKRGVKNR